MKPPAVPDQPVPVLTEPQLRSLFAVCSGKDFEARRDTALLMVLLDAVPRRAELLGMRLEDLNFEYDVVRVVGKGGWERALPFGRETALALDRYLRVRSRYRLAHLDTLWIIQRGPLTISGLRDLLDRRARQDGIPDLHPTCSATSGSVPAAPRSTLCGSPAGGPARCLLATAPRPPMRVPEMPTVVFRRTIAVDHGRCQ